VASRDDRALLDLLADARYRRSDGTTVRIVNALGRFGDRDAVGPILGILREGRRATVRSTAAIALGSLGDRAAIPDLRELLDGEDRPTRMWAMRSLGELRDRGSVDRLVEELRDGDSGVRAYAAGALGEIGDQGATPALIVALDDRKDSVRRSAAMSLAELGDSRALEPVRHAHAKASGFTKRRIGRALADLETRFG
jgi:HEAT repeat protein